MYLGISRNRVDHTWQVACFGTPELSNGECADLTQGELLSHIVDNLSFASQPPGSEGDIGSVTSLRPTLGRDREFDVASYSDYRSGFACRRR